MKTISLDEIMTIYHTCGLMGNETFPVRTQINTGSLNRQLNVGKMYNKMVDNKTILKDSSKNINFRLY